MKHSEPPQAASYLGHVRDGVVVFDAQTTLPDGQAARVQPLCEGDAQLEKDRALQVERLQDRGDGKLPDEESGRLHKALAETPRLQLRTPGVH